MSGIVKSDGTFEECKQACPVCGNEDMFYYKRVNQHIGAYCVFCNEWICWCKQWTDKNWDKRIKERDRYTCQRCGMLLVGREAKAHHKIPQWFMPELRYDLDNGICLCNDCHKQLHGKGGTIKEKEKNNE